MAQDHLPSFPAQPPGQGPSGQHALALRQPHAVAPLGALAQPEAADDDTIDLRAIWRLIVKHRWLLVAVAAAGLVAALLLSFIQTPQYLASTTVQVDKRAPRVVKFQEDPVSEGDERSAIGTQLEILKSRALAERVIEELRLDRQELSELQRKAEQASESAGDEASAEGGAPQGEGWGAVLSGMTERMKDSYTKMREPALRSADQLNRQAVVDEFVKTVKVEQLRNTRMIRISAENADPQLAARMANSMAQAFIALSLERRLESSAYAKTFLETQLALTKAKLEESERRINEYSRSRNILTLDEKTNVINQTYTDFASALSKAEQERIKLESEFDAVRSNPDSSRQVLESRVIQTYKEQRARLDAEYQLNAKIYKKDFPKMQQLEAQINDLDGKVESEVQSILRSLRNLLDTARSQEAQLAKRLGQARSEIVSGQDKNVDFNLLKREVDTNRELYDGLLQQVKEVGVAGGVEANNIQVVDKAHAPLFPHKPRLGLNAAIGLMAGLMLGLLLVFLLESLDDSIKFSDEVEKLLAVPLLGVIPKIREKVNLPSIALLAHEDPRSHLAEAYRSVRTSLQFSTSEGAPRRLVLTSTTKNEGKSTSALALAINFAQLGKRVVLMDGDMRNPTVHKLLGMTNVFGLSNYLSGHAQADGVLVQATTIPNLSVITSGPIPPSPVDLLTGPRFLELLDSLELGGVDYIIIDGPPVLGLADAVVLGNQVHSVLYVAQANLTRKSHIKDAFRRLRMAGVLPRGVVLTKTTAQNMAYYDYQSYYGYGPTRIEPADARA
ncbi:polysaccharide biosynthesis tyrosine autokinase [Limnohabitans sp.]|uniref:GumC family protein n=1 Tax=Limnohabitans sp. TaxID=1907725 RepID=UPI0025C4D742|nr:polysaccharide biosynthesis tyrosine autokinase [Limnohabitans sp.]